MVDYICFYTKLLHINFFIGVMDNEEVTTSAYDRINKYVKDVAGVDKGKEKDKIKKFVDFVCTNMFDNLTEDDDEGDWVKKMFSEEDSSEYYRVYVCYILVQFLKVSYNDKD